MANALIRWVIVVIMGIITFIPNYGILALAIQWFLYAPILISIGCLVWVIALALVLPFTLTVFRWISTTAVTVISSASVYLVWSYIPALFAAWPIYMWGVVVAFIAVGWLLIATPLWRWAKGTLPVTQANHHEIVPHHS